jgi:hypothetical protein
MEAAHWSGLGFIVLTIVVGSLFLIMLAATIVGMRKKRGQDNVVMQEAAILGGQKEQQSTKITGIFLGSISLLIGLFVVFTWIGSIVFGLFMP